MPVIFLQHWLGLLLGVPSTVLLGEGQEDLVSILIVAISHL